MKLTFELLRLKNYKSIQSVEIKDPNCFTVFVGANAVGKTNLFDSIEFANYLLKYGESSIQLFGDIEDLRNYTKKSKYFEFELHNYYQHLIINYNFEENKLINPNLQTITSTSESLDNIFKNSFSRIFIGKKGLSKATIKDSSKLNIDASNLPRVLKRLLNEDGLKEELEDWLQLFIPDFDRLEIKSDELTGMDDFVIYEKSCPKPFKSNLISDGTRNILCLLTALYQSKEPQFLLVEEPENGLNPKVLRELVNFIRTMCKEKGHIVWFNTHSQSIVSELEVKEVILVNKNSNGTTIKQIKDMNLHGLKVDEAWLSNIFGGGIPW